MSYTMKGSPFQRNFGIGSPLPKVEVKNKKNTYTGEGTVGERVAKAFTPENTAKGIAGALAPIGKVGKVIKAAYNYATGD